MSGALAGLRHLAVIGCGGMSAGCYLPALRQLCGDRAAELRLSCVDPDADRAAALVDSWPGPGRVMAVADAVLEQERLDAALVVVSAGACGAVARPLLAAGLPCLIEKPPACDCVELDALAAAAAQRGVLAEVAFNRRSQPMARRCRTMVGSVAGPLRAVRGRLTRRGRRDPDFSLTAIHLLDAAAWCAGTPYAELALHYPPRPAGCIAYALRGSLETGASVELHIDPMADDHREELTFGFDGVDLRLELAVRVAGQAQPGSLELVRDGSPATAEHDAAGPWWAVNGVAPMLRAFLARVARGERSSPHPPASARQPVALMNALQARREHWTATGV